MKDPRFRYHNEQTGESVEVVIKSMGETVDQVRAQHGYYQAALTCYARVMSHEAALESARPWRPDVATAGLEELQELKIQAARGES